MAALIDLTGYPYGRLTVLRRAEDYVTPGGIVRARWECACECGTTTLVLGGNLRSGHTTSCGCVRREVASESATARFLRPDEDVNYLSAHLRIYRARGKASAQMCVECGNRAQDWSYDHTDPDEKTDQHGRPFSAKPEHYSPRCKPCHRIFDGTRR